MTFHHFQVQQSVLFSNNIEGNIDVNYTKLIVCVRASQASAMTTYQLLAVRARRMRSLVFDCVCRWFGEGKRSCDVCSSSVCLLTLADG